MNEYKYNEKDEINDEQILAYFTDATKNLNPNKDAFRSFINTQIKAAIPSPYVPHVSFITKTSIGMLTLALVVLIVVPKLIPNKTVDLTQQNTEKKYTTTTEDADITIDSLLASFDDELAYANNTDDETLLTQTDAETLDQLNDTTYDTTL